jgi:hypothetical protein
MHNMTKAVFALIAGALLAGNASANGFDAKYFEVDENSIMIEEIAIEKGGNIQIPLSTGPVTGPVKPGLPTPPTGPVINPPGPGTTGGPATGTGFQDANQAIDLLDKIVNLAQKIFNIIEKNQPVVNVTTNYANAVPYGTSHWTQLQGWSRPATRRYAFSMKNGYGSEVVKVTYQVHYTYNGNFQGKGKFLTGVTVEPLNIEAAWGYKVSLVSEVPDSTIANVGTSEDPIASMQVQLKWNVHTVIKDITSKAVYYVQGDGFIQEIGTPFDNAKAAKADLEFAKTKASVVQWVSGAAQAVDAILDAAINVVPPVVEWHESQQYNKPPQQTDNGGNIQVNTHQAGWHIQNNIQRTK